LGKEDSSVKAGRAKIIDMAYKLGVQTELYDSQSLPIGSVEVTPIDMAAGYTSLANGGFKVTPHAILEIRNTNGDVVYKHEPKMERTISDRVVNNLNFMLNKVVESGTGTAARIEKQTIAGKTGTTNAYKDAWFVGYTGSLVASVWMGNDDNTSSNRMTAPNGIAIAKPVPQKQQKPQQEKISSAPKEFTPPVVRERTFFERLFGSN
jgi:penicillin-binding protein 1A